MSVNRAYAVDYIHEGEWHHTVVMAPGRESAKSRVRTSRPGATVMKVKRVVTPAGFTRKAAS
jgi:hypothetical protein